MYQKSFKRYEIKYVVTREQKEIILHELKKYMDLDSYGRTLIRNIYYDTHSYRLIRRSLEKPEYKEKLRLRTYQRGSDDCSSFVEIKKKCSDVVYKRRVSYPLKKAEYSLKSNIWSYDSQIDKEIQYFMNFYVGLEPKVYLSYEREAYYMKDGSDFRVTFDENIQARLDHLDLREEIYGHSLLKENETLMEIKTSSSIPLWLVSVLSQLKIYKTSFSKYGKAYCDLVLNKKGEQYGNNFSWNL